MFFNHRTGRCTGGLTRVTREELERERTLEKIGILMTTRHPSTEDINSMNEIFSKRDVVKESEEAAVRAKKDREKRHG